MRICCYLYVQLFFQFIPVVCNGQCDIEIINSGIGGNNSNDLIERVQKDVISQKPDFVIVMIGTNDMVNTSKLISYDSYEMNIVKLCQLLSTNGIDVLLISPPRVDSIYLFERHDKNKYIDPPNSKLKIISKRLESIARNYRIPFVDIFAYFDNLGIPNHEVDKYIRNINNSRVRDGVHPTALGYRLIASQVYYKLFMENIKIRKGLKVICLGDSITFGSGVYGEGTSEGETYPAQLKQMICDHFNKQ